MGKKYDEARERVESALADSPTLVREDGGEYSPSLVNIAFAFGVRFALEVMDGKDEGTSLAGARCTFELAKGIKDVSDSIESAVKSLEKEISDAD